MHVSTCGQGGGAGREGETDPKQALRPEWGGSQYGVNLMTLRS